MDWKTHLYRIGTHLAEHDDVPTDADELETFVSPARKRIEPWLAAVFQAEHLNLFLGSGFTSAVGRIAGAASTSMARVKLGTGFDAAIDAHAEASANAMGRDSANIEDQFRSALSVLSGL